MAIRSVSGLIKASKADPDSHFFAAGAMRGFNSIIEPELYPVKHTEGPHGYFITSERFDDQSPREWTIRVYLIQGSRVEIDTVDATPTDRFRSKQEATTYLLENILRR